MKQSSHLNSHYESEIVRGKDSEIRYLKERLSYLESESMERENVEEIVRKSVEVTKENLELKGMFEKREI